MSLEEKLASEVKISDEKEENEEEELVVDPWTVKTGSDKGVDYDKLISKWQLGSQGWLIK